MRSARPAFYLLIIFFVVCFSNNVSADNYSGTIHMFKKSAATDPFFKNAYGYAVFPTIGKGGMGIGGAYGKGRVYKKGKVTGTVSLAKLSIGFQLGGQAFSEIVFLQDKRAYDEFTSGSFEFDVSASAVVITAGLQAKAGTEGATAGASLTDEKGAYKSIGYTKGMAVFVHTKGGFMYEAVIGGQKFSFTPL